MNTAHSNWTGRAHRTMQGAFGPHTPNQLEPMPDNDAVTDFALVLACVAAVALTVLAVFMWGWA